jgi:hypothetical protein
MRMTTIIANPVTYLKYLIHIITIGGVKGLGGRGSATTQIVARQMTSLSEEPMLSGPA